MYTSLIVFFAVIISVSGQFVHRQVRDDCVTNSHPQWMEVQYGSYGQEAQETKGYTPHTWKAKEYANAKVVADHYVVNAASKARDSVEVQSRDFAYQAAAQAKAAADQEAEQALWKAELAAEEESKALSAVREAELAAEAANMTAINSQNAVKELNKYLLAANKKAEEEYLIAGNKYKFAEELKQKAASTTEARDRANYVAALAAQKAKSAEEAFWRVKHRTSSW